MAPDYVFYYYWNYNETDYYNATIEKTLEKIVKCDYTLRDQEKVCDIEHDDFKAAKEYVQAGFQIARKIEDCLNH